LTWILYCNRESGHSYKIALALALIGLRHELRAVDLRLPHDKRPLDFQATSLFGEVPVLIADHLPPITQSNVILNYLAEHTRKLDGHTPQARLRIREWLGWEANRIGFSLPNLRFSRCFTPMGTAIENWLADRLMADMRRLETALQKQPYLVGDQLTIADISCAGYLYFADQIKLDLTPWPCISGWLDRLAAEPGWQHPYALIPEA